MSVKVSITWNRPSADVPWFNFNDHPDGMSVINNAVSSGKVFQFFDLVDSLTAKSEMFFESQEIADEIRFHPAVQSMYAARDAYFAANGITMSMELDKNFQQT